MAQPARMAEEAKAKPDLGDPEEPAQHVPAPGDDESLSLTVELQDLGVDCRGSVGDGSPFRHAEYPSRNAGDKAEQSAPLSCIESGQKARQNSAAHEDDGKGLSSTDDRQQ